MKSTFILISTLLAILSSALVAHPVERDAISDQEAAISSQNAINSAQVSLNNAHQSSMAALQAAGGAAATATGTAAGVTGATAVATVTQAVPAETASQPAIESTACNSEANKCSGGSTPQGGMEGNACVISPVDTDTMLMVSIPAAIYDAAGKTEGISSLCGKTITVVSNLDGSLISNVVIVERCGGGCDVPYGLDMSNTLFTKATGYTLETEPNDKPVITWWLNEV